MSHLDPDRPRTRKELRDFALTVGGALIAFGALFLWRRGGMASQVVLVIGASLAAVGVLAPGVLGPVYRVWMRFALLLSKVTTPILMGTIYFLVLTPMGLIMRLSRRRRRRDRRASMWVDRPVNGRRSVLERQF